MECIRLDPDVARGCATDLRKTKLTPNIELIIAEVCSFYNIDLSWLIATKQGSRNWPRLVVMYVSRLFGHTLKVISEPLGCLHRSTVSAGICKCKQTLLNKPKLKEEIQTIYQIIKKKTESAI